MRFRTSIRSQGLVMLRTALPATPGTGFKPQHFEAMREDADAIGFVEIHAENYMGAGGPPHAMLRTLRERFALSIHGVGLSIGGAGPLDRDHLSRLKASATDTNRTAFPNISPGLRMTGYS